MYPQTVTAPYPRLAATPPLVSPIAYVPRPRSLGIIPESPYANRIRAGIERMGMVRREQEQAASEAAPFGAGQVARTNDMVMRAENSQTPARAMARLFRDAGEGITEDTAIAVLVAKHDEEVVRSVLRYDAVARNANTIPVIDSRGDVVAVDVSDNPAVLKAQQQKLNSTYRPPTGGGGPLVTPLTAPTPEQNAAARVFGQDVPSPHAVLAAQVAAQPDRRMVMILGLAAVWFLLRRKGR